MKKMVISFRINQLFVTILNKIIPLNILESVDILNFIKIDLEKGIKIFIVEIVMKENHTISEFEKTKKKSIISKISGDDHSMIYLVQGQTPDSILSKYTSIINKFIAPVVWDTPTRLNGRECILSAIGDEKDLNRIALACKLLGKINQITFTDDFILRIDLLKCLTDKQREILIKAKKNGYYQYPRKISSEFLSKELGLSKTTTIEHLRKAENRIINQLLFGF